MHQVVTAQLAARRAGTHSTKTRSEVSGGGAKPWRQKGTGRSRAGTTRAPGWVGGGIAHGPKPRDYSQKTPKKMIKLALASALSDRAADGNVIVVDKWDFETPKTADAKAALSAIGAEGKVLVVFGDDDTNAWKSFRNLTNVHCLHQGELNTYDVLNNDVVVFTEETLPTGVSNAAAASTEEEE
jgi:large subunit ribosomal protein L4